MYEDFIKINDSLEAIDLCKLNFSEYKKYKIIIKGRNKKNIKYVNMENTNNEKEIEMTAEEIHAKRITIHVLMHNSNQKGI